jgi:hypothetical protein
LLSAIYYPQFIIHNPQFVIRNPRFPRTNHVSKQLFGKCCKHCFWLYFAWNVCCFSRKSYIIFLKIKFFSLNNFYCFVISKRTASIVRLKDSAAKVFSVFFYKVRTNCDPTKPYNKSLITSFARSVRESIAKNLRQYFPVQTSHSVNNSIIFTSPVRSIVSEYELKYVTP